MVKSMEAAMSSSLDELIAEERKNKSGGGFSGSAPSGSWRGRGGRRGGGIRKNTSSRRGRGGVWRGRGGRGRGGFRGRGRGRRGRISGLASNRPSGAFRGSTVNSMSNGNSEGHWGHDKYEAQFGGPRRRRSSPVKKAPVSISTQGCIHVSGLDSGVTSDDVKDIFQQRIGIVTKAFVVFDKNGNSTGTAKVTFARSADAREAIQRLDKALVDKKQMRIRMDNQSSGGGSSSNITLSRSPRRAPASPLNRNRKGRGFQNGTSSRASGGRSSGSYNRGSGKAPDFDDLANPLDRGNDLTLDTFGGGGSPTRGGGFRGRGRRGGFRGRGRRGGGRGAFRNNGSGDVTSDMLDKELSSYMNED